jgi:hypothetical protein
MQEFSLSEGNHGAEHGLENYANQKFRFDTNRGGSDVWFDRTLEDDDIGTAPNDARRGVGSSSAHTGSAAREKPGSRSVFW